MKTIIQKALTDKSSRSKESLTKIALSEQVMLPWMA